MTNRNQVGDVVRHPKLGYGDWVVDKTEWTGGSQGRDVFPDGWKMTFVRLLEGTIEAHPDYKSQWFYEEGTHTEDVSVPCLEPIRRLRRVVTVRYEPLD